jgi:hypothetical protein
MFLGHPFGIDCRDAWRAASANCARRMVSRDARGDQADVEPGNAEARPTARLSSAREQHRAMRRNVRTGSSAVCP